ncbi:hypothetical protein JW835_05885 [bacterium]|nr:hypothetical protein [bacterium]
MKTAIAILNIAILVFLFNCHDKSTEPGEGTTEDILTVTMDSKGGEFTYDDLSLVVPENTFKSQCDLRVTRISNPEFFAEYTVTKTYKVEGIPENIFKPIQFIMKYNGSLTEETYMVVGQEYSLENPELPDTLFIFTPCSDSSGYLFCEWPPSEQELLSVRMNNPSFYKKCADIRAFMLIAGIADYTTLSSSIGHFRIQCPRYLKGTIDPVLGNTLEEVYAIFHHMGFQYVTVLPTLQEIDLVKVQIIPNMPYRYVDYTEYSHSYCWELSGEWEFLMFFYEEYLTSDYFSKIRLAAGRSFFKLVLEGNTNTDRYKESFWFRHACISWCEELFTDETGHYPIEISGYETEPLDGLKPADYTAGYGQSAVVKYLVDRYQKDESKHLLAKIYEQIRQGTDPVTAILDVIPDPVSQWWTDFLKEYISGNIYPVSSHKFVSHVSGAEDIQIATGEIILSGSYRDLSARLYRVNLSHLQNMNDVKIEFEVIPQEANVEDVTVLLFMISDHTLTFIDQGGHLILENVKALTDYENDLMAVVVNSHYQSPGYDHQTNIDLRLNAWSPPPDEAACQIELASLSGDKYYTDGTMNVEIFGLDIRSGVQLQGDDTYTGEWQEQLSSGISRGMIKLQFNPGSERKEMTYLEAWEERETANGDIIYEEIICNEDALQAYDVDPSYWLYYITHENVCDYLSKVECRYQGESSGFSVNQYSCTNNSHFSVRLRFQDGN